MAFYTGRRFADLGDYGECKQLDHGRYISAKIYKINFLAIGLCIPDACTLEEFKEILVDPP